MTFSPEADYANQHAECIGDKPGSVPAVTHKVVRVRTKETLCHPDVSGLIMRGARKCGFPVPAAIMADIARDIASDNQGLFIGYELCDKELSCPEPAFPSADCAPRESRKDALPRGQSVPRVVSVAFLPCNAFYLAATIGLAYSEKGPRRLVAAVGDRMREWLVGHGHHEAMVLNLFHTDRSYVRGLAHFGTPKLIGSVIRFKF